MKKPLSPTVAFVALFLGTMQGLSQSQMELAVLPVTEIQTIDDHFLLQVRVTNQAKEAVLVDVPAKGVALGLEVNILAPDGWVKKKQASAQNSGITVVSYSGSRDALLIQPNTTQQFTLDLRDYFEVIDLRDREYSIEVKIVAMGRSNAADPNGKVYPANWSGKLSLSAKNPKGTTIRF